MKDLTDLKVDGIAASLIEQFEASAKEAEATLLNEMDKELLNEQPTSESSSGNSNDTLPGIQAANS